MSKMRLSRSQEQEYKRRKKDRPNRPPLMEHFYEQIEKNKLTDTLQNLRKGLDYDRYKYTLLWRICSPEVREKLCNLRIVKNKFALRIEDQMVQLHQSGNVEYFEMKTFKRLVTKMIELDETKR